MHCKIDSSLDSDDAATQAWLTNANDQLNELRSDGLSGVAKTLLRKRSVVPTRTNVNAKSVAIMIKGAFSSSADRILDRVASLFPAGTKPIYFSYNGPDHPEYTSEDTVKQRLHECSKHLEKYFEVYDNARFHLVCHSLGGLIPMQLLQDMQPAPSTTAIGELPDLMKRIEAIYLLASPVNLDGDSVFLQASALELDNPLWNTIKDYDVLVRSIPILNRVVAVHCTEENDLLAPCVMTCLKKYHDLGVGTIDEMVYDARAKHPTLPFHPATLELLHPYILRRCNEENLSRGTQ